MKRHIHSVIVSYNRLELTKQAIISYLETMDLSVWTYTLCIVDNASTDGTREFIQEWHKMWPGIDAVLLEDNFYPGYATNRGWEVMPPQTTLLHRSDNDFAFLPGWCDEVVAAFQNKRVGQVGLRTDEEELGNTHNVGGNNVIRRELWDQGLRYDERPWPKIAAKVPGYTEDSFLSPAVRKLGWEWSRVARPCIRSLSVEAPGDPDFDAGYYERTWADRGMSPR